ncbi:hypothetical protein D3875_01875 [Deinococcus cavernae]|uniref:Type 4 fimbrial biogenesis protein PilX N-terminal domain-containing protein n=1 Tax=Deinococcus cavernae TaxID=2320857 RepID=A0A418VGQ1_9DEIO|nr:pilus assembly PilX N-terminal domain-containing protein [Deinococcus cavernae]RJF75274.1 hypothetical protein D3875_01875 [Deinococcus cavernae]
MKVSAQSQQGFALIAALGLITILMLLIMITTSVSLQATRSNSAERQKGRAFYVAQSGLERAIDTVRRKDGSVMPATVNSNLTSAQWLAAQINNMEAALPGAGTFKVTATAAAGATAADPAVLTLTSTGTLVNSAAIRAVEAKIKVNINKVSLTSNPMVAKAPAALTVTGLMSSINGSAPIAGDNEGAGLTHKFKCPATLLAAGGTCNKSSSAPDKYTLTFQGSIPSTFTEGAILRPTSVTSSQRSEERYVTTSINKSTNAVEMTVLSDYIQDTSVASGYTRRTFNGNTDIAMQEINSIPAILMPVGGDLSKVSANVKNVCNTYECMHYTMSPNDLFASIMGGTKDQTMQRFKDAGMYTENNFAPCSQPAVWMRLGVSTASLSECTTPQLMVIDARGLSGSTLDLNLPSQDAFRGMLYVISDKSMSISMQGNGSFAGAVVMDIGNGSFSMNGTGNFNMDCKDTQAEDGTKKTPKLCYDEAIMAQVNTNYLNTVLTQTLGVFKYRQAEWNEVAGS